LVVNGLPGVAGLKGEPGTSYIEENAEQSKDKSTHLYNRITH